MTNASIIIIDIGAGMWRQYERLLKAAKNVHIVSFEPHPITFQTIFDIKESLIKIDETVQYRFKLNKFAVTNRTKKSVNFYLVNDPAASSLSPFDNTGVSLWKYSSSRCKRFEINKTIKVDSVTLTDYIQSEKIIKNQFIELLNIDVRCTCLNILDGISDTLFAKIKRIIIRCMDTPFELYTQQSDIVDVIDKLKVNGFLLIKGIQYSSDQERVLEFVNNRFSSSQKDRLPISKLNEPGDLIIDVNVNIK